MFKRVSGIEGLEERTLADVHSADRLLEELLSNSLVHPQDWDSLPQPLQEELSRQADSAVLLGQLVERNLLTTYQAERISQGSAAELMLGNYRVLDFLGKGTTGSVFKAEHRLLRRPVAIKVVAQRDTDNVKILERFFNEMWIVAHLQHPNIVAAVDAGELPSPSVNVLHLQYLVMEYVPGLDLEETVKSHGPLAPSVACDLIYQVADALAEADRHRLVHRDIKPSNIRVTPEGQSKLLDFGVARSVRRRLTEPGVVLGSVAYLAPEQAQDSRAVDIRADIYGLGGTLFWCLTGQAPFPVKGNILVELAKRATQPPPSLRAVQPELPQELEKVVAAMMATNPDNRYASPRAVMQALIPFLARGTHSPAQALRFPASGPTLSADNGLAGPRVYRILIVDDEPSARSVCRCILDEAGLVCDEAEDGKKALAALANQPYDLILLDIDMPEMNGVQVLRRLREAPPSSHLKVIMASGRATGDQMAEMLLAGADDYLAKPFSVIQLRSRVKSALRLKDAQERSQLLYQNLLTANHELEQTLHARDSDLIHARNALVLALAELVAHRDNESGSHLLRIQKSVRHLAECRRGRAGFLQPDRHPFHQHARMLCSLARHRQGRHSRLDLAQTRSAGRRGAGHHANAHDHRSQHLAKGGGPASLRPVLLADGH